MPDLRNQGCHHFLIFEFNNDNDNDNHINNNNNNNDNNNNNIVVDFEIHFNKKINDKKVT